MEEEILKQIRKEYKLKKREQDLYKSIKERLTELENNPYVQEYLLLLKKKEEINLDAKLDKTEKEMINSSFLKYQYNIKETNKIYVYLGTFMRNHEIDIVHGSHDHRVARDSNFANYREYQDLEATEGIQIPINDCEEFEQNNHIIFPESYLTDYYYYRLQESFIEDAVKNGQKKAVARILKNK